MIMRAVEHALPWERVEQLLREMNLALRSFDCERAIAVLEEAVVEYKAAAQLHDLVAQEKRALVAEQGKVTDLQARRARQGLN
jgi:hypothetical protein